jgi:hypothetical protein
MKKTLQLLIPLLLIYTISYTQSVQPLSQLKIFQQSLMAANVQFSMPKDFKEIKALYTGYIKVDFAMEIPNAGFQVWYNVESLQQPKLKTTGDASKQLLTNPDSLYNSAAMLAATRLAGKDNFTAKNLPQEALNIFHADNGKAYQLNLYDRPETNHYQYGLLISLQKNGIGFISMLFLSNENGPEFYKKVNKAYYSVCFK